MKLLMMSMLLLSFLPVICSGHRTPPRQQTPYLSKGQIRRICEEITDLKEADEDLKKANEELIKANEGLKKDNEYLKEATIDLQNRISAIESSSNAPGK